MAALVTSLTCIPFLGIIFGCWSLYRTKDGTRKGRSMAIAGIVIGGITLTVSIIVFVLVIVGAMSINSPKWVENSTPHATTQAR